MKIRIKENSIRFRLTKSEVQKLCDEGVFEQQTKFDDSVFSYAVKASAAFKNLQAQFSNGTITLLVPNELLREWYKNEKVGFYHTQNLNNGESLSLTLEKDFVCMDETIEDQSDNYPNPKMLQG